MQPLRINYNSKPRFEKCTAVSATASGSMAKIVFITFLELMMDDRHFAHFHCIERLPNRRSLPSISLELPSRFT
jgi:hypothetical protein